MDQLKKITPLNLYIFLLLVSLNVLNMVANIFGDFGMILQKLCIKVNLMQKWVVGFIADMQ